MLSDSSGDDAGDLLLGPTFVISLLAALLLLVEMALPRILFRRVEAGGGSPPRSPPRLHQTNKFWMVLGLGLVNVVFELVSFAKSVLAE